MALARPLSNGSCRSNETPEVVTVTNDPGPNRASGTCLAERVEIDTPVLFKGLIV